MAESVSLAIPGDALEAWLLRLAERGIETDGPKFRFAIRYSGCMTRMGCGSS
jgi:hypothetical protein